MLLAAGFTDAVGNAIILMLIGSWCLMRLLRTVDTDGAVKNAASKGIVSMLGRWLK